MAAVEIEEDRELIEFRGRQRRVRTEMRLPERASLCRAWRREVDDEVETPGERIVEACLAVAGQQNHAVAIDVVFDGHGRAGARGKKTASIESVETCVFPSRVFAAVRQVGPHAPSVDRHARDDVARKSEAIAVIAGGVRVGAAAPGGGGVLPPEVPGGDLILLQHLPRSRRSRWAWRAAWEMLPRHRSMSRVRYCRSNERLDRAPLQHRERDVVVAHPGRCRGVRAEAWQIEILDLDGSAPRELSCSQDRVFELTRIAGPVAVDEQGRGARRHRRNHQIGPCM